MGVAIDAELLQDSNNPSYKVLNYVVQQHNKRKRRLQMLSDYYDGKQEILDHSMVNNQYSSNNKVVVNHAKYITDMNVGFTTGNPIAYTAEKGKNIDPITDEFSKMDVQTHDAELEKDLSVFGVGFEVHYLKTTGFADDNQKQPITEERIECIDPRGIVMCTDDTVEHNPLFAIHIQEKFDLDGTANGYLLDVYTKTQLISYRTRFGYNLDDSNIDSRKVTPHYFGDVPVVEFRNNEERQGDFEQCKSLIDAYNTLQSDRITDKQDFIDALLIVYGFSLMGDDEEESKSKLKNGFIDGAPGKGEDGASVEWLTKQLDETQVELLAKSIENDIHKISYVPNMNDENFMGNVSGEAMKYKLFGLLNLLSTKTRYLVKGLRRRLALMQNILNKKGQGVDASGCKITFTPNIPVNLSDIITNMKNADGIIPRTITYGWLPDVDDPEEVADQMKQQKADDIKDSQQALSGDTGKSIDDPEFNNDGKGGKKNDPDSDD
ncbi:phage portal protein [Liquorilactobacillus satsumensis]|uniref:phage portal protein n=1 Tax=Liquorilactobacillus satsumensis TaxID=259059 RepID=UPI0021C316C0|nr:phage portal protein [Liquorilactobacillus satsumensis]MCP9358692.1 phage portal protein [Liquorilactobacillus satsumensis]MCP9372641.1 phage portal protein [Liquorilactobacillus satsumensis]